MEKNQVLFDIFKSLIPLLVTILTIYCNNRLQKKYKLIDEQKSNLKRITDEVMLLNSMQWNAGRNLLEMIQNAADDDKKNKFDDLFQNTNYEMLNHSRMILGLCDIMRISEYSMVTDFTETFEIMKKTAEEYINILDWYNSEAAKTPICKYDSLCDEAQIKLIEISTKTESELIEFCKKLRRDNKKSTKNA